MAVSPADRLSQADGWFSRRSLLKARKRPRLRAMVSCPRCKDHITTALVVPHILPKSEVSEELLAHIVISKFIDRQPLYINYGGPHPQ